MHRGLSQGIPDGGVSHFEVRIPRRLKEAAEKVISTAFPQRLEAAIDYAPVTARVELVPFPKPFQTEYSAASEAGMKDRGMLRG